MDGRRQSAGPEVRQAAKAQSEETPMGAACAEWQGKTLAEVACRLRVSVRTLCRALGR